MMMASLYPPPVIHRSQYVHDSPVLYGGPKLTIKQEPIEDLMEHDSPVDMTLTKLPHPGLPSVQHHGHVGLGSEKRRPEGSSFFGQYIQHHCHSPPFAPHQPSMPSIPNSLSEPVHSPAVTHCPPSVSPTTSSSSDMDGFIMNGSNGKLSAPAALDVLSIASHQRAKREFVPDNKKDDNYWCKRLKNNDSARRSRVKRKALEKMMETRLLELQKENIELKHEMTALKRRFGIEDSSSDSSSSPLEQNSPLPTSSPEETADKSGEELEPQSSGSENSRSTDDTRVYNTNSITALTHALGHAGRDRTDSMGSSSSSLTRISTRSRPNSRNSQSGSVDALRTDVSGALDLTSDHSNRSTPAWESSSSESFSSTSTNCNRRYSSISSDCSSADDGSNRNLKFVPLKCRWKKEHHSAHNPVTEELQ